jgi:hypothetical protein
MSIKIESIACRPFPARALRRGLGMLKTTKTV